MRNTIKKHIDFETADGDIVARSAGFLVRMRKTRFPGDARYGLIVTKRTFRHAVDRNRARRLLRVWIRHGDKLLRSDCDYVFIARPTILRWGLGDGVGAMKRALRYLKHQSVHVKKDAQ